MKNFLIGLACGIVLGFLACKLFFCKNKAHGITENTNTPFSFNSTLDYLDFPTARTYIDRYKNWSSKPTSDTQYFLDSAGINQIVTNKNFYGFYINLGIENTSDMNTFKLIFSGVGKYKNSSGQDSIGQIFAHNPNNGSDGNYLDKINPCPGPSCPQ